MKGFYQVTQAIKDQLLLDDNVNTVTVGNLSQVDLSKQTIFPLSHMIVTNISNEDNLLRFSISILAMDIVNYSKEQTVDVFIGNNNWQDVINTQLAVLNKLMQVLRGGTLHQDLYQVDGNPNFEIFYERFENNMAGLAVTFDVIVPNDISIC
jgi:hypothetical protein